jgi:hypothetical protein
VKKHLLIRVLNRALNNVCICVSCGMEFRLDRTGIGRGKIVYGGHESGRNKY